MGGSDGGEGSCVSERERNVYNRLTTFSAIVGIIAVTERLAKEAEEENTSIFFAQLFDKQLLKQRLIMDMFVVSLYSLFLLVPPDRLDRTNKSN